MVIINQKSLKANIILIIVTLFWGAGFPITKFALETISPLYHIGFRFIIASALLSIIFYKKLKEINREVVKCSFILSIFLFGCYALQTIGLQYTTASKSAFFSGLSVLIVPIFSIFYLKSKLNVTNLISIGAATIGLYFLSNSGNTFSFNFGDFITILSCACYSWQLLFTGTFVQKHDATLLSIIQMFFVAVFGFIGAFVFEPFPMGVSLLSFNSLLFSAVLCTAFAFWVQTVLQRSVPSSHIALIWSMEPVFGAITSYLFLREILGVKGIIGGALIVAAMVIPDIKLPFRAKVQAESVK